MISLQTPNTGYGVMAFGVCPTTFGLVLILSFLNMLSFLIFEMGKS